MANFYLDVSAIGNEYQAYSDVPATWGVPQDGNGKAGPGHAAACAILKINCSGATGGGTSFLLLGVSIPGLSGTGAALATTMAANINAASGTATPYSLGGLPLNRVVFARVNPAVNTEVQVMLRIADDSLNGQTVAVNNVPGVVVTPWAGGVSGPFAYLVNGTTVFGKTIRTYGLLSATKAAGPYDPGTNDVTHCRTRRNGADLTVVMAETNNRYDWQWHPTGSDRSFLMDDGTVWPGDAGLLTVSITTPGAIAGGFNRFQQNSGTIAICSRSGRRFRLLVSAPVGPYGWLFIPGGVRIMDGVILEEAADCVGAGLSYSQASNGNTQWQMLNSLWIAKGPRLLAETSSNPNIRVTYSNTEFAYFGLSGNVSGIVSLNSGGVGDIQFVFSGCKFYDRNGVYAVTNPVTGGQFPNAGHRVVFDGCSGVTDIASGWPGAAVDGLRLLLWENFGPSRDWRVEGGHWLAEWRSASFFPTLTSVLPTGEPWSAKVLIRNTLQWGVQQRLLKLPGFYRAVTGVRNISVEYLSQYAFSTSQLGILVAYLDENSVVRYETTLDSYAEHVASPALIPTSSAAWALNGTGGYTAYKTGITTQYPIKSGTEYIVYVVAAGAIPVDQSIYVNGEASIA